MEAAKAAGANEKAASKARDEVIRCFLAPIGLRNTLIFGWQIVKQSCRGKHSDYRLILKKNHNHLGNPELDFGNPTARPILRFDSPSIPKLNLNPRLQEKLLVPVPTLKLGCQ